MSSAVTEASTFDATVIGPDDGDARNAASVRTGLGNLADRTKWLNDNKANLSGCTFTGGVTINTGAGLTLSGGGILVTSTSGSLLNGPQVMFGPMYMSASGSNAGYIIRQAFALSDANATIYNAAGDLIYDSYRVPAITAARTYTFSASNVPVSPYRRRVRVVRVRATDAFAVIVKRSGGATIGQIDASSAGFLEFEYNGTDWVACGAGAWTGTVSSVLTTE